MKHIEFRFQGRKGLSLYSQGWQPDSDVKAVLVVVPGVAEHGGRYIHLAHYFVKLGYAVYGLDHRGHGKSEGRRGHVEDFSYFIDDLQVFLTEVRNQYPGKKIILIGHSMGGTIGLAYSLRDRQNLAGLILSGVAIKVKPEIPGFLIALLKPLAFFLPKLGLKKLDSSILSRDPEIVKSYDNDPLVFRGKLSARLAIDLLWTMHRLQSQVKEINIPVLILHGESDRLSLPIGARLVYEQVGSKDKTLTIYDSLYHEILNEPEKSRVLSDIENWIRQHS